MRRIRVALVVTLLGLYTGSPARANGRFPKAQMVATVPGGDGSTVFLRATFGVLVSHDGGAKFRWLCEQALGFSSTWDPPIAVTRDARLWVALSDGLRVTSGGCDVTPIPALKGELVADLTTDATGERVYLITSTPGKPAHVWRMKGESFERLGPGLSGIHFDTIEVAPSKPSRLYFTGAPDGAGSRAHFFRSDDGGVTLIETKPKLPNEGRLFVSAIDPKDPDRVFVRQLDATGSDVLLSTDGGTTFKSVLHMGGAMFGFAHAEAGDAYWAGGGDPKEGIWRSTDRGEHWEPMAKTPVFCLHAKGDRLFVCSNPYTPGGFALAASTDGGKTVKALATFDDVTGPVACDAGSGTKCAAPWEETRAAIATSAHLPTPEIDALPIDASLPAVAPASSAAAPAAPPSRCACRFVGARDHDAQAVCAVIALGLAAVARRRRRDGSGSAQHD